jgi:hypothetical protein
MARKCRLYSNMLYEQTNAIAQREVSTIFLFRQALHLPTVRYIDAWRIGSLKTLVSQRKLPSDIVRWCPDVTTLYGA